VKNLPSASPTCAFRATNHYFSSLFLRRTDGQGLLDICRKFLTGKAKQKPSKQEKKKQLGRNRLHRKKKMYRREKLIIKYSDS
jgi:hypothetical protein